MNHFKTQPLLGKRIIAALVDYTFIYAFFHIFIFLFGEPNDTGGYSVSGLLALVPILIWAVMTVGVEHLMGETFGNTLVDLKPISTKQLTHSNYENPNLKLTFGQSLKRHLLDPVDLFFFGLVGILTINCSEKNQRVGDMWAETIVIKKSDLKILLLKDDIIE